MPRSPQTESEWSTISTADAVGRLFPRAAEEGASLDGIIPGRYWAKGAFPADATKIDRNVQSLISGDGAGIRFVDNLEANNIHCPYYAWRSWIAASVQHAKVTSIANSSEKQKLRKDELKDWDTLIKLIERLGGQSSEDLFLIGSKTLIPSRHSTHSAEHATSLRANVIRDLQGLSAGCEYTKNTLSAVIEQTRINRQGNPDIWKTAFYTQMGILWKITTGASALTEEGPFWKFLNDVVAVISGDSESKKEYFWSQYKTLEWRLESNSGFADIDRDLILSPEGYVDDYTSAPLRGAEIRHLVQLADPELEQEWPSRELSNIAVAAIEMQGHCSDDYSLVIQEIVMTKLEKYRLLTPTLIIQLGWIHRVGPASIDAALRSILQESKSGDFIACLVIRLAAQCSRISRRLTVMMGGDMPPSVSWGAWIDIQREFRRRSDSAPEWHGRDGKWKAFIAAAHMLTIQGRHP